MPSLTRRTPVVRVLALAAGATALVSLLVLAFSWPAVTAEPRDLPVAVVGPAQAVEGVRSELEAGQPGVVDLVEVGDRDAAVAAVERRDVYGAVVLGETPEVLTASAAGQAPHQLLTGLAGQMQQEPMARAVAALQEAPAEGALPSVVVTDVVPLDDGDPRGAGLTAAAFPILLGGMAGGLVISTTVIGALRRVLAVVAYACAGGTALTGILQGWFGVLQGDWWANAGAIALALAAVAAPLTGLAALLGRAGIGIGAALVMLVGNPVSGVAVPPEFLPGRWGEIGQWFPPGATGTLVRELSYFPDADTVPAWTALGLWAGVGLALSLVGRLRSAGGAETDAQAARER